MKTLEQLGISPAPWKIDKGSDGWIIVRDAKGKYATTPDGDEETEAIANAYIVAAAPDMYKRGFELVFALEDWMQKYPPSEFSTFGQAYQLLVEAMNNFRDSLAKAAGESEVER